MLVLRPGVGRLSHTDTPAFESIVAFVGGPPFFVAKNFEGVRCFGVVHDGAHLETADKGECVETDVDLLVHHTAVGETSEFSIDEPNECVWILEPVSVPAKDFGVDAGTNDVVKVVIYVQQLSDVLEQIGSFLLPGLSEYSTLIPLDSPSST